MQKHHAPAPPKTVQAKLHRHAEHVTAEGGVKPLGRGSSGAAKEADHSKVITLEKRTSQVESKPTVLQKTSVVPSRPPCKIFTFWDYTDRIPPFVEKNVESWIINSKTEDEDLCLEPILVNDSNVRLWIPDIPSAYFELPPRLKTEALRYALLYHNGGVFIEDDVLVVKKLAPILESLSEFDLFSYASVRDGCRAGRFKSGFLGGKQGSAFLGAIWAKQRALMALDCRAGEMNGNSKLCCNEFGPLAGNCDELDVEERWEKLGQNFPQEVFDQKLNSKELPRMKYHCFHGSESFEPPGLLHVTAELVRLDVALKFFASRGEQSPMGRLMYHFRDANFSKKYQRSKLFDPKTFVGSLYRRSGVSHFSSPLEEGPVQTCAKQGERCECDGKVYYIQVSGPQTLQAKFLDQEYGVREVAPNIQCNEQAFGRDPAPGEEKYCLCQAWSGGEQELLEGSVKTPVLNLLFLVNDGIWNAQVWRAWLAQAPVGAAKVFVHCTNFGACMKKQDLWSLPGMEVVPTVQSAWCYDLVTPEVQLLRKALSATGRTSRDKYIFLSESTLPLKQFSEVHEAVIDDPRSAFCFFPVSHWGNMTDVTQGRESYWAKHEQWVTLNVADAEKLVRDWQPVDDSKQLKVDFHKMRNRPEWPEQVYKGLLQGPKRVQSGPCADEFGIYATVWGVYLIGEQCTLDPKQTCTTTQDLFNLRTCHTLTLWPYKPEYDDMEQLPKRDTAMIEINRNHPDHPVSFERVGLAGMHVLSESGSLFARKFTPDCTFEVPIQRLWDGALPAANPEDPFGWLADKVAGWLIG